MDFEFTEDPEVKGPATNIDWDIRFFRRYPKEIDFTFAIEGRTFSARTVDYSLIGVGIVIDDVTAPLTEGDYISLAIEDLALKERGKVAWIRKGPSSLRVGILKTEPFRGRFTLYPLPDVLIGLQRTLKTGILNVCYGPTNKKVYVRNGNVISSASNYEKDRLGDVLFKNRRINKKQYDKAAEMKRKSGARYTDILLHMGYLKPPDLIGAAELQTRRILGSLFVMRDAEFKFIEGPLPSLDEITLDLSVADLIYRALKRHADVGLIDKYLLDSVVDFSSNPLNLFQNIHFTAADKAVLSCVDGKTSIRDIVLLPTAGRINPLKVIYALLEARFLKIKEKDESPSGIHQKEILGRGGKSNGLTSAEIESTYSEYKDLDYYSILGLDWCFTDDDLKKAYYRAARKYHPDMHRQMPEDMRKKLIEIFTCVTNAYLTLTDPVKRNEYDSEIASQVWPEAETSGTQSCVSVIQEDVEQKEDDIQQMDGTKPEDSSEIARQDIPETETSGAWIGMSIVQKDVEQKKNNIPQPDSTTPEDNSEMARLKFRNGKTAFAARNFQGAARLFAMAISYDCSVSEYHYYHGYALGMLGKLKEAVQELNRANELGPQNADVLAELGHVYLKLDFPLRAKGYFDRALKLNPSNDRAKEGVKWV